MVEKYARTDEAEQTLRDREEYMSQKNEETDSYEHEEVQEYNPDRYEGTLGFNNDGQPLEPGRESVDAMLEGWKANKV